MYIAKVYGVEFVGKSEYEVTDLIIQYERENDIEKLAILDEVDYVYVWED